MLRTMTASQVEQEIPYHRVAEFRNDPVWDSAKRKREWLKRFSTKERDNARRIFQKAKEWDEGSVPSVVQMSDEGYWLWRRIASLYTELQQELP